MKPGGTALTVMPFGPVLQRQRLGQAVDRGLRRDVWRHVGAPECVLDDEMLTMRPQPASIMSGRTAWMQWKTPLRLTSMTRCQRSNDDVVERLEASRPAALTRIGHRPELGANAGQCLVDLGAVRDVGGVGELVVGRVEVEHGDVEAVGAQSIDDRLADARAASGHHGVLHECGLHGRSGWPFQRHKNLASDYENRTLG